LILFRGQILLVLPAAFLLAACAPLPAETAVAAAATETPAPAAAAMALPPAPLAIGLSERILTVGQIERTYYLYVPKEFDPGEAVAVVLIFHGFGQEGSYMVPATGFNQLADANGFLAVYPNGSDPSGELSWNAGDCCGYAYQNAVDDTAFVRRILDDLGDWAVIDPQRIFATGFSNGGLFSYRLACDLSETIAAVAPVSGTLFYEACRPKQPVSVIHIHGMADDIVPYAGGKVYGTTWPPAAKGITAWAGFDGCESSPQTEPSGIATRTFYSSCREGTAVELFLLKDLGHRWPSKGIWPASQTIWDFFIAHPKAK
jgi:polyhydroxybutyrate depolymerase